MFLTPRPASLARETTFVKVFTRHLHLEDRRRFSPRSPPLAPADRDLGVCPHGETPCPLPTCVRRPASPGAAASWGHGVPAGAFTRCRMPAVGRNKVPFPVTVLLAGLIVKRHKTGQQEGVPQFNTYTETTHEVLAAMRGCAHCPWPQAFLTLNDSVSPGFCMERIEPKGN